MKDYSENHGKYRRSAPSFKGNHPPYNASRKYLVKSFAMFVFLANFIIRPSSGSSSIQGMLCACVSLILTRCQAL